MQQTNELKTLARHFEADRAEGTPGPWWTDSRYNGNEMGCHIIAASADYGPPPGNPTRGMVAWASAVINTEARRCEANARRIANVPKMEDWIIAAAVSIEELEARVKALSDALSVADDALAEAEAILGGEYADHYQILCDTMIGLRSKIAALQENTDATNP